MLKDLVIHKTRLQRSRASYNSAIAKAAKLVLSARFTMCGRDWELQKQLSNEIKLLKLP